MRLLFFTITTILFFSCGVKNDDDVNQSELDTISFSLLTKKSCKYLQEQQEKLELDYKIGTYENWYYDQETGELTFSDSGVKKLIIDYEEVGSISYMSNTWLWAWDNEYVLPKVKSEIPFVKNYGERRNFEKLTKAKWDADLYDGWEMTSISAYLMNAKGAYRIPSDNDSLYSFLIFKNIRWADSLTGK